MQTSELSLIDLSSLPRTGVKGKDLSVWIKSKGYHVDDQSNLAYLQRDGILVVRLSAGELLLLPNPTTPFIDPIALDIRDATFKCYPVRRQDSHYWFVISGQSAPPLFAKLCGIDLSPRIYSNYSVSQTMVARANSIVVRGDLANLNCYYLLGDSSMKGYMWTTLVDAMDEFDGRILPLKSLLVRP